MKLQNKSVGEIYTWLDQGPAMLLKRCSIPAPCLEEDLGEFIADPEAWPKDIGWTIKLLLTGEIIDVHPETLEELELDSDEEISN